MSVTHYDCMPDRDPYRRTVVAFSHRDIFSDADPCYGYPDSDADAGANLNSLPNVFYD